MLPIDVDREAREELRPIGFAEYQASKQRGFVVIEAALPSHPWRSHYWKWCEAANVPFLQVTLWDEFAAIEYNSDTTGYPYTFNPDTEAVQRMWAICRRHWKADNSSVSPGQYHFHAYGIPNQTAIAVAGRMWGIMQPFFRTPEFKNLKQELGWMAVAQDDSFDSRLALELDGTLPDDSLAD